MGRMSRALLLLVVLSMTFVIATASGFAAEKTTLSWGLYTNIPARVEVWEGWAERFEALRPDVEVEIMAGPSGWYDKLQVWIAGGVAPDVAWMGSNMFTSFTDLLLPLNDMLERSAAVKSIIPQAHTNMMWQGQLLGITYGLNTHTVFYNKDLFNEAGLTYPTDDWTWDDAMSIVKRMTSDRDGDGTPDRFGINVSVPQMAWNYGGDVYSPDGTTININRPATIQALQLFADIINGTARVQAPSALGLGDGKAQVAKGYTAMAHRGVFDISYFQQNATSDWDVVGMPAIIADGQRHRATFFSPEAWVIPRAAKNPELAKEFIDFILQEEQMSEFAAIGAIIPSQPDVATKVFFQIDPSKNLQAFVGALDYVDQQYWAHPAYNQLGLQAGDHLDSVLKGQQPAQSVVPELANQINGILKTFFANK